MRFSPSGPSIYSKIAKLEKAAIARPYTPIAGISGFVFDIPQEETVSLRSQITDHFVEANYAVHDHWALMPETITLTGKVGEMVLPRVNPPAVSNPFVPERKAQTLLGDSKGFKVTDESWAEDGSKPYATAYERFRAVAGRFPKVGEKQMYAWNYIQQLWSGRILLTVETPWGVYRDMAIESAEIKQDATSTEQSEVTVTFKRIRTTESAIAVSGELVVRERETDAQTAVQSAEKTGSSGFLNGLVALALGPLAPTYGIVKKFFDLSEENNVKWFGGKKP